MPLVPEHVRQLTDAGIRILVQPSEQRVFGPEELTNSGAVLQESLDEVDVVLGVKEIPIEQFQAGKTYVFFSHTIKAQPYNMPMLKRMMELGCTLIDYERIVDDDGRRLVSFSRFAGLAGMIDTLWVYGRRLAAQGVDTPLAHLKQATAYPSLEAARLHIREVAEAYRAQVEKPLVLGITGMGRVSRGALEIARHLDPDLIAPDRLPSVGENLGPGFHLVLFDVPDLIERVDGGEVDNQEYRLHPERYRSAFPAAMPFIDVLVNGIYWEDRYPRVVSRAQVEAAWAEGREPRLAVIGDISCDIEGSVEVTLKPCDPGTPCFVYDVDSKQAVDGVEGRGPVIMATDILPTELPREASHAFSEALVDLVPALAAADTSKPVAEWNLPGELQRAVILDHGKLTPDYAYLQPYVD